MKWHYLELIWQSAKASLLAEAARAYLGILWWFLEPALFLLAFYIVFTVVIPRGGADFIPFLLTGLVIWKWFASSVIQTASSILDRYMLMQQLYVPKIVFPTIVVIGTSLKFTIIFLVLLVFLVLWGYSPSIYWLIYLPVILFVQFMLILSLGWLCAALVPFFPDLRIVIENIMMLGLFMSGIFYEIRTMSEEAQFYFHLNPMAVIIEAFRDVLLHSTPPQLWALMWVALGAVVVAWMASLLLGRFDRIYPKVRR